METYPGADLTTDQILDALSRRVNQQLSSYGRNVKDQGFKSMVRYGVFPHPGLDADFEAKLYKQENILSKLLYETRTMCSSTNVASSAPAEIITRIAMEIPSRDQWQHNDVISMSHVCKPWREAIVSYPLLWNISHEESEMVTRMCLERSKSLPLEIYLSHWSEWSFNTMRLLKSHTSRFETLELNGSLSDLSEIFTNLKPSGKPILRELTLWDPAESDTATLAEHASIHLPILSHEIPTLRKVFLSSFPVTLQLSAVRHLTEASLINPGPTGAVLDLLANNPCLEKVDLVNMVDDQGSPREDQSISLPHLRCFSISECDDIDILRCLHLPRLEPLKIEVAHSFTQSSLPGAYQPYSTLQLSWDLGFHEIHIHSHPEFCLAAGKRRSPSHLTAKFGELPPNATEVLGPSTVEFIKYLCFRETDAYWRPSPSHEFANAFHHMERLETLTLACLPASLREIFSVLDDVACCPLLHTLIVQLPKGVAVNAGGGSLLGAIRARGDGGNAIRRLRVVVASEKYATVCSQIFNPLVKEVEILVRQQGMNDGERLLVWD